jgi:hypothetical protein
MLQRNNTDAQRHFLPRDFNPAKYAGTGFPENKGLLRLGDLARLLHNLQRVSGVPESTPAILSNCRRRTS